MASPKKTSAKTSPKKETKKSTEKKTKKAKNPDAPKRPLSPYIVFGQHIRPIIKEEHPDFTQAQIIKEIATRWNKLTEAEKDKYKK